MRNWVTESGSWGLREYTLKKISQKSKIKMQNCGTQHLKILSAGSTYPLAVLRSSQQANKREYSIKNSIIKLTTAGGGAKFGPTGLSGAEWF